MFCWFACLELNDFDFLLSCLVTESQFPCAAHCVRFRKSNSTYFAMLLQLSELMFDVQSLFLFNESCRFPVIVFILSRVSDLIDSRCCVDHEAGWNSTCMCISFSISMPFLCILMYSFIIFTLTLRCHSSKISA